MMSNPIVTTLSSSVPILGMANSVISLASSFFNKPDPVLKSDKKSFSVGPDEEFQNEDIKKFVEEITPYINFYEGLEFSNRQYASNIENLKKKYENLPTMLTDFKTLLKTDLGIRGSTLNAELSSVSDIFSYASSNNPKFNYHSIIKKRTVQLGNNRAKQIGIIVFEVENFYAEYIAIVNDNIKDNIKALKSAETLKEASKEKITKVIGELETYQKGGFINKFEAKIEKIKELRRSIDY